MARAAAAAALALLVFFSAQAVHVVDAAAAATLSQGQSLGATDKVVSPRGTFELGFFTPTGGDPSRRYLGVMYAQSNEQTVPWVANRDAPVNASSSYSATVTAAGELQVLEEGRVVWRTNSATSTGTGSGANVTLTVLDNGNVELTTGGGATVIWRSFDHPTDTFLPGMNITLDRRGGAIRRTLFTSWRSDGDPGTGNFTLGQDPLGSAQLYIWRTDGGGSSNSTYWRSGQWANTNFVGVPWRSLYVYGFKLNGDPYNGSGVMFYVFNTYNSSEYRFMLHANGTETCYMLLATGDWETVWSQPTDRCQAYDTCGANARCAAGDDGQPICTCLTGFRPRNASEYSSGNWTQGCVRSSPLTCSEKNVSGGGGGDGFADLPGVRLPNFAAWGSTVGDADACKQSCLGNCSCGAYSYSIGTGCLTWGQDLLDIYQFPDGEGYDLQIKVPAYLLGKVLACSCSVFFAIGKYI